MNHSYTYCLLSALQETKPAPNLKFQLPIQSLEDTPSRFFFSFFPRKVPLCWLSVEKQGWTDFATKSRDDFILVLKIVLRSTLSVKSVKYSDCCGLGIQLEKWLFYYFTFRGPSKDHRSISFGLWSWCFTQKTRRKSSGEGKPQILWSTRLFVTVLKWCYWLLH